MREWVFGFGRHGFGLLWTASGSRTVWAFTAKATAEIAAQLQTTTKFKGQRIWVTTPRTHPKPLSFEILNKDDPPLPCWKVQIPQKSLEKMAVREGLKTCSNPVLVAVIPYSSQEREDCGLCAQSSPPAQRLLLLGGGGNGYAVYGCTLLLLLCSFFLILLLYTISQCQPNSFLVAAISGFSSLSRFGIVMCMVSSPTVETCKAGR